MDAVPGRFCAGVGGVGGWGGFSNRKCSSRDESYVATDPHCCVVWYDLAPPFIVYAVRYGTV